MTSPRRPRIGEREQKARDAILAIFDSEPQPVAVELIRPAVIEATRLPVNIIHAAFGGLALDGLIVPVDGDGFYGFNRINPTDEAHSS